MNESGHLSFVPKFTLIDFEVRSAPMQLLLLIKLHMRHLVRGEKSLQFLLPLLLRFRQVWPTYYLLVVHLINMPLIRYDAKYLVMLFQIHVGIQGATFLDLLVLLHQFLKGTIKQILLWEPLRRLFVFGPLYRGLSLCHDLLLLEDLLLPVFGCHLLYFFLVFVCWHLECKWLVLIHLLKHFKTLRLLLDCYRLLKFPFLLILDLVLIILRVGGRALAVIFVLIFHRCVRKSQITSFIVKIN